ncbi:MAG: hypothetical protein LUQ56_01570 [Methylococcaceae bacterium]|jgi:hypothetical protein|nr:hypothetical protein [Methylococcaceae bacterium]OYV18553.1 MAG: hypothetical protein CG441_1091 [Methylococcaceae bacterium NSM2-1]
MKKLILICVLLPVSTLAISAELYGQQTGQYLGQLGGSKYNANSAKNPYGRYGSKYSAGSTNNPYGRHGSKYSTGSINNPYATNPPVIRSNPYGGKLY